MTKVSIIRCADYRTQLVEESVERCVSLIGGMPPSVKTGSTVLIKPNLLSGRDPADAVCTHPEVVRAVVRMVRKAGAMPVVGDSPGSFFTIRDVSDVYEKSGMKKMADEEGVELVRFDKSTIVKGYPIAQLALDASLVISVPKLKTHAFTVMTGAIKNTFGMVPGLYKVECHRSSPKPKDFVKTLLDVYQITKPGLAIMDAIISMEGEGPAAGTPRQTGLLMAGYDAVSLDAVMSAIVGLPAAKDIIVNEARKRKAGEGLLSGIEVVGERLEDVKIADFKLPKTAHRVELLPDIIAGLLTRFIVFKPFIDEGTCEKCKICEQSCPSDAITINKDESKIHDKMCIRCFCCHEVCPYKSIYIKKNFIANLLWSD